MPLPQPLPQIVGYDPRRGKALLLYDDGEDEWIALEGEELTWHCQLAGPSGIYPGLGRGALSGVGWGWRTSVRGCCCQTLQLHVLAAGISSALCMPE